MTNIVRFTFPFPPSTNMYWRRAGTHIHISDKGRAYRSLVGAEVLQQGRPTFGDARVCMDIVLYPPDKRARDCDNYNKAILDALEHSGVFENDNQVKELHIFMREPDGEARAQVEIRRQA